MLANKLARFRLYPLPLLREIGRQRIANKVSALRARFFPHRLTDQEFLALVGFRDAESCLHTLHQRLERDFFLSPRDRPDRLTALRSACPWAVAATKELAERIRQHNWTVLGASVQHFGQSLDWHSDFARGIRFPLRYRTEMPYGRRSAPADYRVPWELSRCHHLVILGKAYWLSEDEHYAEEFCTELKDWWDANPYEYGINWTCPMEAAFRAINWLWSYSFFRDSSCLDTAFRIQFFKSLYQHTQFIRENPEYSVWDRKVTTNHFLSDLVGLLHLDLVFPASSSPRRFEVTLGCLMEELEKQVFTDGVSFEASTAYHRLATELFLTAFCLLQRNGIQFPESAKKRLEGMLEFTFDYIKPSGRAPLIGDGDGGRLLKFCLPSSAAALPIHQIETAETDHRGLLSLGAVLFQRPEWARKADRCGEEVVWLLGSRGSERFRELRSQDTVPALRSRGRPESGFYLMRNEDSYLLLRGGANGQAGLGGHAHNDVFSFEMAVGDSDFLVDPGTYTYAGDPALRNLFRSTSYHNTVRVDGEEINRLLPGMLFYLPSDAQPKLLAWQSTKDFDYFAAEHTGYTRLPAPVVHRRKILLDKKLGLWLLKDEMLGEGQHKIEHFFHPGAFLKSRGDSVRRTVRLESVNGKAIEIHPLPAGNTVLEEYEGWISPTYGILTSAFYFCYRTETSLPATFLFGLFPAPRSLSSESAVAHAESSVEAFRKQAGTIF